MKLSEELSTLRNLIKEVDKDSEVSDSLLYSLWKKARGKKYYQEISRGNNVGGSWAKQRFCIELEKKKSVQCDCLEIAELGCDVLVSVYELPKPIGNNYSDGINITNLGYKNIGMTTPTAVMTNEKYDEIKSRKARASIINKKLYIFNDLQQDHVFVSAIWDDPLAWNDVQSCQNTNDCEDVLETETGLSEDYSGDVLKMALDLYFATYARIQPDRLQDRIK